MTDFQLPETLPFKQVFGAVLSHVIDNDHYSVICLHNGDKADFDREMDFAIFEATTVLGLAVPNEAGDWLGNLYAIAEELGYVWPEEDEDE